MAVPDWPGTYGYNLFLYPWQTWFFGPWDVFIEHGHRLLGAAVGFIAIGLVVVTWWCDSRNWMKWLAVAALVLVILQGVLGGQRVLQNTKQLAQIHGIVGPTFLGLATAILVMTSRWWHDHQPQRRAAGALHLDHVDCCRVCVFPAGFWLAVATRGGIYGASRLWSGVDNARCRCHPIRPVRRRHDVVCVRASYRMGSYPLPDRYHDGAGSLSNRTRVLDLGFEVRMACHFCTGSSQLAADGTGQFNVAIVDCNGSPGRRGANSRLHGLCRNSCLCARNPLSIK